MAIPWWMWLKLLLLFSTTLVDGSDVFSEALLSFKSGLVDSRNSLSDWSSSSSSLGKIEACSWSGVTCNSNSTIVTGLDLSSRGLSGPISGGLQFFHVFVDLINLNLSYNSFSGSLPVEIFNLTSLRSLDISRNNFSGHFPNGSSSGTNNLATLDAFSNSFTGPLPLELSQIETLKVLNLAGSYFTGPIPPEYGSFKSLEFIHLAGNSLSGKIPPELGRLQTLTHMEIGYNSYNGSIPWQLGNMSAIQYLDIAGADLSGPIPPELGNLTKLDSLFLFRNQLSGFIPEQFKNLVSLQSLDLSDNHISGPIPDGFSQLKNLSLLSLFYNDMEGTVPEAIAELPMLKSLLLWNNFFSGSLPQSLGRSSKLELVDVSTNFFNGSIPPDICAGGMLSKIIIFSNNFSGEIPPSLSKCFSLVRLRLEDNLLSGPIPLEFVSLPDISYVDLSMNSFTGSIPADISNASKLEYFNVSNNPNLGGFVPLETWSLPNLHNFSASYCNIAGDLPTFQSCKSVSVIELHSNSITGVIPDSISNCKDLEKIDLSNNHLSGQIPEGMSRLPSVGVVDLSHNNLNGGIPRNLSYSSTLLILNVSFNDISGSIPQGKIFSSMPTSAFVGNPNLCGLPLQSCSNSKEIQTEFTWILVLCALVVVFIAIAVSGLFYFQRVRRNGQWKMVSFSGLPQFTPNDVLKSFDSTECGPVYKAVLPTGITVLVKKIEWDAQASTKAMLGFISQMGNARQKNLARLLGCCHNKHLGYLLYDYSPNGNLSEKITVKRDWSSKFRIVIGIAKGLCFLHHECYPSIPHGDFRTSNISFDEYMEPQLSEFGFKFLLQLNSMSKTGQTDAVNSIIKEAMYADVYNFGECVLEILMNGRMTNGGKSIINEPFEVLVEELVRENQAAAASSGSNNNMADQEEMKLVLEVALLCTRSRPLDRPSMKDALNLLSGFKR